MGVSNRAIRRFTMSLPTGRVSRPNPQSKTSKCSAPKHVLKDFEVLCAQGCSSQEDCSHGEALVPRLLGVSSRSPLSADPFSSHFIPRIKLGFEDLNSYTQT